MNFCRKEILYALVIMLTPFGFGYIISYPSPVLPYYKKRWELSEFEVTAFNAVTSLTAIFGPFITSFLLKFFGRKKVTFILSVLGIIGWALLFALKEDIFWYGILIRAILGLLMGAFSAIGPQYLAAIAPPELTGFFGNINQLSVVLSIVFFYLLGEYEAPWALNTLAIATHLLQCILIWFIPEKREEDEPDDNEDSKSSEEMKPQEKETIFQMKYAKFIIIGLFLMIFPQFSGANAILTNLNDLFEAAHVPMRPGVAAAITKCAQLISVFISGLLVDLLGRRFMWVTSSLVCAISLLIFGLNEKYQWNNILPIAMIFIYQFGFGLALGPMPWYVVPEMFPQNLRPTSSSINSMECWAGSFAVIFIYPLMNKSIGEFGTFIFFCCISFISAIFGFIFIKPKKEEPAKEESSGSIKPEESL